MKKTLFGLVLASAVLIGSTFASSSTGTIVGNDTDEHGCKGSAWYTWSENTQTCVRSREQKKEIKTIKEETKNTVKINREAAKTEKKSYQNAFHADYGYIWNYFVKLTDKTARTERQTTVSAAVEKLLASKETLNKDFRQSVKNKTPLSTGTIQTRVSDMITTFYASVIPYVDTTKKDSFDAFIAGKKDLYLKIFTVAQLTWEKNQQVKTETKEKIQTIKTSNQTTKATVKAKTQTKATQKKTNTSPNETK